MISGGACFPDSRCAAPCTASYSVPAQGRAGQGRAGRAARAACARATAAQAAPGPPSSGPARPPLGGRSGGHHPRGTRKRGWRVPGHARCTARSCQCAKKTDTTRTCATEMKRENSVHASMSNSPSMSSFSTSTFRGSPPNISSASSRVMVLPAQQQRQRRRSAAAAPLGGSYGGAVQGVQRRQAQRERRKARPSSGLWRTPGGPCGRRGLAACRADTACSRQGTGLGGQAALDGSMAMDVL